MKCGCDCGEQDYNRTEEIGMCRLGRDTMMEILALENDLKILTVTTVYSCIFSVRIRGPDDSSFWRKFCYKQSTSESRTDD